MKFVRTGKIQPGPASYNSVIIGRPGLQKLADEVSDVNLHSATLVVKPVSLRSVVCCTSVIWQYEEWHAFCLERQRIPWQSPQRAHPDWYLFVVAVLITSWLKQMTDLAYLVGSEM